MHVIAVPNAYIKLIRKLWMRLPRDGYFTLPLMAMLEHMEIRPTPLVTRLFCLIDGSEEPEKKIFRLPEFVAIVWNLCSLTDKMIARWMIEIFDVDSRGGIDKFEMDALLRMTHGLADVDDDEEVTHLLDVTHPDDEDDLVDVEEYLALAQEHPMLLQPVSNIRKQFRAATFGRRGERWWRRVALGRQRRVDLQRNVMEQYREYEARQEEMRRLEEERQAAAEAAAASELDGATTHRTTLSQAQIKAAKEKAAAAAMAAKAAASGAGAAEEEGDAKAEQAPVIGEAPAEEEEVEDVAGLVGANEATTDAELANDAPREEEVSKAAVELNEAWMANDIAGIVRAMRVMRAKRPQVVNYTKELLKKNRKKRQVVAKLGDAAKFVTRGGFAGAGVDSEASSEESEAAETEGSVSSYQTGMSKSTFQESDAELSTDESQYDDGRSATSGESRSSSRRGKVRGRMAGMNLAASTTPRSRTRRSRQSQSSRGSSGSRFSGSRSMDSRTRRTRTGVSRSYAGSRRSGASDSSMSDSMASELERRQAIAAAKKAELKRRMREPPKPEWFIDANGVDHHDDWDVPTTLRKAVHEAAGEAAAMEMELPPFASHRWNQFAERRFLHAVKKVAIGWQVIERWRRERRPVEYMIRMRRELGEMRRGIFEATTQLDEDWEVRKASDHLKAEEKAASSARLHLARNLILGELSHARNVSFATSVLTTLLLIVPQTVPHSGEDEKGSQAAPLGRQKLAKGQPWR